MRDRWGRTIDYLRLSLTDRCNLRCRYCMPDDVESVGHDAVLRYEEMMSICQAALKLGIDRFKITGGEPLVRRGAVDFMRALKGLDGVKSVTVTTNGMLLEKALPDMIDFGIDGINISLDSLDAAQYRRITGGGELSVVVSALRAAAAAGVNVKVNAVLLAETKNQILRLAEFAKHMAVDVRFIELMPIGFGTTLVGLTRNDCLEILRRAYPDLMATDEVRGNGPADYYKSRNLCGRIGFIAANSHAFCASCNRLRLTSTGFLKPCLCYDDGVDLRAVIRRSQSAEEVQSALTAAIAQAIYEKPAKHCFSDQTEISEHKTMNQIGG